MSSPFANPFRQFGQIPTAQPRPANPFPTRRSSDLLVGYHKHSKSKEQSQLTLLQRTNSIRL